MAEKDSLAERTRTMDPRLIYALIFLFTAIPILHPIGFPVPVTATTRSVYDIVEKLPAGSHVWYGVDFPATAAGEMTSSLIVTTRHMFSKSLKVMFVSFMVDGPVIYAKMIPQIANAAGKKYGEDYVYMGFYPGVETGMAALASGLGTAKDYRGTPIDSIPAFTGVKNVKDFALTFTCTSMSNIIDGYLRQLFTPFRVTLAVAGAGLSYPQYTIYYPQQIAGILNGMKGAAEYEKLTGFIGPALSANDAFTILQATLIVLVILTNVAFLVVKMNRRRI